jgi:hypothetical protein
LDDDDGGEHGQFAGRLIVLPGFVSIMALSVLFAAFTLFGAAAAFGIAHQFLHA